MEHLDALDRMANPPGGRDFGEFGGVNASVEVSTTFTGALQAGVNANCCCRLLAQSRPRALCVTVLDPKTLPAIFEGELGPEKGARAKGFFRR